MGRAFFRYLPISALYSDCRACPIKPVLTGSFNTVLFYLHCIQQKANRLISLCPHRSHSKLGHFLLLYKDYCLLLSAVLSFPAAQ